MICASILTAEIEYEIHSSYGKDLYEYTTKIEFPLLIRLHGADDAPVKDAIVALKRLGPDGWSEEEIIRDADKRTDKNGMILIMYPGNYRMTSSGEQIVDINGAVTVIAEGYHTITIELHDYFKEGRYIMSESTIPQLKINLKNQAKDRTRNKYKAQQD
jgi:hypothetical protein